MKDIQKRTLTEMRTYACPGRWGGIHAMHFDWWMFPLEEGRKLKYCVLEDDARLLLSDSEWVEGFREAAELVSLSWAWDLGGEKNYEPAEQSMAWNYWSIRLAKIIRSAWLFEQWDILQSLQTFARAVRPPGGFKYGAVCLDEILLMRGGAERRVGGRETLTAGQQIHSCPPPSISESKTTTERLDDNSLCNEEREGGGASPSDS